MRVNQKTDVWAFGVLIVQMWDGRQRTIMPDGVFDYIDSSLSPEEQQAKAQDTKYWPNHLEHCFKRGQPYLLLPPMPATLYDLVNNCLQGPIKARPASSELEGRLDAIEAQLGVATKPKAEHTLMDLLYTLPFFQPGSKTSDPQPARVRPPTPDSPAPPSAVVSLADDPAARPRGPVIDLGSVGETPI
ncbi:hypothetical protein PTSG_13227 [Salpingoeca rosetta]|uniref:Protein kinase domain-containing protein n=1 Tax=Salpingoeca rosetta (strain ATCC 50818 / BSB-021) TaxID=946362 RepID=F2UTQ4_SALR5|nr:uncharacterized protein PTSG_13227 [Salpingoeca rosetta]EGD74417.1 hypothetical protein PTSG_13227 [Salpingoeca rosetta]|eukprot:XP_004987451.1 hypothetical protein PTSG_13227 [Salpingoeca rosetta]